MNPVNNWVLCYPADVNRVSHFTSGVEVHTASSRDKKHDISDITCLVQPTLKDQVTFHFNEQQTIFHHRHLYYMQDKQLQVYLY